MVDETTVKVTPQASVDEQAGGRSAIIAGEAVRLVLIGVAGVLLYLKGDDSTIKAFSVAALFQGYSYWFGGK